MSNTSCSKILDMYFEEDSASFFNQAQIWLHTFFCGDCAKTIERYQATRGILTEDFFAPSPGFEDAVMNNLEKEEQHMEERGFFAGGLSTRSWVIAGLIVLISLVTAYFGFDVRNLIDEAGMSFLLPMGITIGIVLSVYGVFFIGSHLKELSEYFGL